MPSNDFPVLDGIAPSWADVIVRATPLAGGAPGGPLIEMKDIKAINTGTSLEIGEQRGTGGRIIRRTVGAPGQEASVTFYRSGYQKMLRALLALAPRQGNKALIALVHFNIQVQHTPPGEVEIYEYRIKGCRFKGRTMNAAEGSEAQEVEQPLSVAEIADMIDGVECVLV